MIINNFTVTDLICKDETENLQTKTVGGTLNKSELQQYSETHALNIVGTNRRKVRIDVPNEIILKHGVVKER